MKSVNVSKEKIKDIEVSVIDVELPDIKVKLMNYGATWLQTYIKAGDEWVPTMLEYADLNSYYENELYVGATVGPHAGRIKDGKFKLNNQSFSLEKNNLGNSLHSGSEGVSFKLFNYELNVDEETIDVEFDIKLPKGDFPGNKELKVIYSITGTEVEVTFEAVSDEDTLLNFTNHAYFSLGTDKIDDHYIEIPSKTVLELDETNCPITEMVVPEHLDASKRTILGNLIEKCEEIGKNGIDDCYLLKSNSIPILIENERISLSIVTDYNSVVVFTQGYDPKLRFKGKNSGMYNGICFETQYPPNFINMPNYADLYAKKGEKYRFSTKYRYIIKK